MDDSKAPEINQTTDKQTSLGQSSEASQEKTSFCRQVNDLNRNEQENQMPHEQEMLSNELEN